MDSSLPGSSVRGDSPGENTGMGCHDFLQGIFLTQGLNSGLPHCRQILYHLSHQGSPPSALANAKMTMTDLDASSFPMWNFSLNPGLLVSESRGHSAPLCHMLEALIYR